MGPSPTQDTVALMIGSQTTFDMATRRAGEIRRCVAAICKRSMEESSRALRHDYVALAADPRSFVVGQRLSARRHEDGTKHGCTNCVVDCLIAGQFDAHTANLQGA